MATSGNKTTTCTFFLHKLLGQITDVNKIMHFLAQYNVMTSKCFSV